MPDSMLTNLSWKFFIAGIISVLVLCVAESWWGVQDYPPSQKLAAFRLIPVGLYLKHLEKSGNGTVTWDCGANFCLPVFLENFTVALLVVAAICHLFPYCLVPAQQPDSLRVAFHVAQFRDMRIQTPFYLVKVGLCISNAFDGPEGRARGKEIAELKKRIATMNLAAKAKMVKLQSTTVSKEKMVGFLLSRRKAAEKDLGEVKSVRDHERQQLEKQREENRFLNNAIMKRMDQIGRWYDRS